MVEIRLTPQAAKQFEKLPKLAKKKVEKALLRLEQNPQAGKALRGELEGSFSLRAWPYRIIYQFLKKEKIVWIVSVIHRQSAY